MNAADLWAKLSGGGPSPAAAPRSRPAGAPRAKTPRRRAVDKTTGRELQIDREELSKHFEAKSRAEARARLDALRARVKEAERLKLQRLEEAVQACRDDADRATQALADAKALLARARADVKAAEKARVEAKTSCRSRRKAAVAIGEQERRAAAAVRDREAIDQRALRRKRPQAEKRIAAATLRAESDDFVEQNIDASLIPLWRDVRAEFSGTPHRRFEEFMRYVEEHPDAALRAREKSRRSSDQEFEEEAARFYAERAA